MAEDWSLVFTRCYYAFHLWGVSLSGSSSEENEVRRAFFWRKGFVVVATLWGIVHRGGGLNILTTSTKKAHDKTRQILWFCERFWVGFLGIRENYSESTVTFLEIEQNRETKMAFWGRVACVTHKGVPYSCISNGGWQKKSKICPLELLWSGLSSCSVFPSPSLNSVCPLNLLLCILDVGCSEMKEKMDPYQATALSGRRKWVHYNWRKIFSS